MVTVVSDPRILVWYEAAANLLTRTSSSVLPQRSCGLHTVAVYEKALKISTQLVGTCKQLFHLCFGPTVT